MSCSAPDWPWTAIVGILGIAGTAGTAYLSHIYAERQRRDERDNENRTRFHKERFEAYAAFVTAVAHYKKVLQTGTRAAMNDRANSADAEKAVGAAVEAMEASAEAVNLLGTLPVQTAAHELLRTAADAAAAVYAPAEFGPKSKAFNAAREAFYLAARNELDSKD